MSSVESLWDDDNVEEVPKRFKTPLADSDHEDSPRPTKRPRQTLFLAGSDDEDSDSNQPVARRKTRPSTAGPDKDIDIDAMFGDIDDLDDDIASRPIKTINADDLERQVRAERRAIEPPMTPHQILSSSPVKEQPTKGGKKGAKEDSGEKKERRKPVHLNENLLASENGFPQLIKSVKDFKPKGKGHEASDLNRLLGVYNFWTHGLYPKTQFRDTVSRIEKLCHSKRMQVKLSVWRDEFKGVAHEPDTDLEGEQDEDMDAEPSGQSSRQQSVAPSNASQRSSSPPAPPTSRPPSAASEFNYDEVFDDDIDAFLQGENSTQSGRSVSNSASTSKSTMATTVDDDDRFWEEAMDMVGATMDAHSKPPPPPATKDIAMDEDEDMWDIVDQVNQEAAAKKVNSLPEDMPPPSPPRPPPEGPRYADPSEWDDMYE